METIRTEIKRLISSIAPFDIEEREHLDFVQTWIASGAQMFRLAKPATPPIHLVSYFVLVDEKPPQLLLTDHKKSGLWLPPGGHIEPGEHPKEAVQRECREELGIEADFLLHDPLFATVTKTVGQTAGHTDVSLWYVLKANSSDQFEYDKEEFHTVCWFSPADIPYHRTDPHMKRFIQKLNLLKLLR
jgi:8-oxo-dGTP diphosphatase